MGKQIKQDPTIERLERLTGAVQNLLILQGLVAGISGHAIRKIAGVNLARVTAVSRHLKKNNDKKNEKRKG